MRLRKFIKDIDFFSYVNEEDSTLGEQMLDCSLGVNPFGCSEKVKGWLTATAPVSNYPMPFHTPLREAIVEYWHDYVEFRTHNVRLGTGSIGVLQKLSRIFLDPGDMVLGIAPQFTDYCSDIRSSGAEYTYVPLNLSEDYKFSPDDFIKAMNDKFKLIYIDNPNNPTGQVIPLSSIETIVQKADELDISVIIDEAYGDFMDLDNSAAKLINKYENLIVTRTFSKGFGLAGARVGYLISSEELCENYAKVDTPFEVTTWGAKLANKALSDPEFILRSRKGIRERKLAVAGSLKKLRSLYTDFEVPIICIECPDKSVNLYNEFKKRGIITEHGFITLGDNFTRVRVARDGNDKLVSAIQDIERSL